jgi:hypothetical protein
MRLFSELRNLCIILNNNTHIYNYRYFFKYQLTLNKKSFKMFYKNYYLY